MSGKLASDKTLAGLEVVQRAWAEHGRWDLALERVLAEELKCGRRQVRAYRLTLEGMMARGLDPESRAQRRAEVEACAWETYRRAFKGEQFGVAIKSLDLLVRVGGLQAPETQDGDATAAKPLPPVQFPVPLPHYDPDAPDPGPAPEGT